MLIIKLCWRERLIWVSSMKSPNGILCEDWVLVAVMNDEKDKFNICAREIKELMWQQY
ncbi:hypothetical protein PSCICM_06610 [Pseudomonas cichorii]|nr:hypothetical protein PSCICM_06610 [Pseudomonas cichorii]